MSKREHSDEQTTRTKCGMRRFEDTLTAMYRSAERAEAGGRPGGKKLQAAALSREGYRIRTTGLRAVLAPIGE